MVCNHSATLPKSTKTCPKTVSASPLATIRKSGNQTLKVFPTNLKTYFYLHIWLCRSAVDRLSHKQEAGSSTLPGATLNPRIFKIHLEYISI